MTQRRPLVNIGGAIQEAPAGDTLAPDLVLPGRGSINASSQSLTASVANLVTGTRFQLATSELRVGSRFRFTLGINKTAAGAATWSAAVKFGVNNAITDAAIATLVSGTNTALADQAQLVIITEVLTLGAAATAKTIAAYGHSGSATTGLGSLPLVPGTTATFDSTATTPWIHIDITPGLAAVMTAVGAVELIA